MTNLRTLITRIFVGTILTLSAPIFADSQGNTNAEKQRIENKIQDQKLEDQRLQDQRQEQKNIDRQLEDRRLEQKRQDDARQRRDRNDVAMRGGRSNNADEDRTQNALNQMMDVNRFKYPQSTQYNNTSYGAGDTNGYTDNTSNNEGGCADGSCAYPGNNGSNKDCAPLNCCDKKFVRNMEFEEQQREQEHQNRVEVVEQWNRDHLRD